MRASIPQGNGERVNRTLDGIAYWREYGDQFRSLGAGRYEVPSRSSKSKRYEVNIEEERCDCPDHIKGHNTCSHIYGVVIAAAKPVRIPSRERFQFSPEQINKNLQAMGA